ncbi:MAG TPA: hypothetical protein VN810_05555, partial [Terriglobales bacterium]|nr:hypothetical protein [Terriglobales bacterium]
SWKTRWENSIDGTNTPYRTLVSEGPMNSHRLPFRASKVETMLPAGTDDSGYLAGLTANWEKTKNSFSVGPPAKSCSATNAK